MNILTPKNFYLNDYKNKFLWKYLDLYKFFDLVINKELHFTRLDQFEDSVEGLTAHCLSLKYYTLSVPVTDKNINDDFSLEDQSLIIRSDKLTRQEFINESSLIQKTQFANCWFIGEKESMAMWKIYSNATGIAVKVNAKEVIETVLLSAENYKNSDFDTIYLGQVDYKNIWPFDPDEKFDNEFNGLKKDKSYIHENEFRFVVAIPIENKNDHKFFKLPFIDLSNFDVKIIASPFMKKWQFDCLKKVLSKYQLDRFISLSEIDIK